MTTDALILYGTLAVLGIGLSALYSGMETGLYTMNRVRLALRRNEGDARAMRLGRLIDRPTRMLAVILLGTNIANATGTSAAAVLLEHSGLSGGWVVVVNTLVLVPVLLLLAEILPKDLFRLHGDRWCYACSAPMTITRHLLTVIGIVPLVELVGRCAAHVMGSAGSASISARHRMSDLLKEGAGSGVLSAVQTALLDRTLELRHRTVGDEMITWSSVRTISADASADTRAAALASPWTRLPVVDTDGAVLGVVSVIDLGLSPDQAVRSLLQEAERFEVSTSVPEALTRLRHSGKPLGVVQRDGRPVGLVTMKDLVETLTGELVAW